MIPFCGFAGDRNRLCNVSPVPKIRPESTKASSDPVTGRMVREMRFQSGLSAKGTTGWMLRVSRLPVLSVLSPWS